MSNLPHPIKYQGSKRNLASFILGFFLGKIYQLIEPFAGTASISIAASANQYAQRFWLNDLNKPLIELLQLIIRVRYQILTQIYGTSITMIRLVTILKLEQDLIKLMIQDYFYTY